MKIGWSNRTALQYALEVVLHTSRLYPLMFFSGQKESRRGFRLDRGKELCEIFRQRNHTDRMLAFRRSNHYLRLLIERRVGLDSLHGVLHAQYTILQAYIFPTEGAKLTYTDASEQAQQDSGIFKRKIRQEISA